MLEKRRKNREAALKAWETMRLRHQEERVKGVEKLTDFITPSSIGEITHPEVIEEPVRGWSGNGVVKQFNKTPEDIACGPFWEVRWAYGCPLNCSYCYLRGTMRGRMKPSFVRFDEIRNCLIEAFRNIYEPQIFNSGELCDSLMNPPLMAKIVDVFEEQDNHKVLLLSKCGKNNVGFLLEKFRKQTICVWSINSEDVAKKWETAAASPLDRIDAASLVWEAGYDTRVRIDPIFPIDNWKQSYSEILDEIFESFYPNRVILGTPRGLWKTIHYANEAGVDMSWTDFFQENTGWGKKIDFNLRKEIYTFFYKKLKDIGYPTHKISMCKETIRMWKELGFEYKPKTCNCYGKNAFKP
jgi:spore photoproduct lyase